MSFGPASEALNTSSLFPGGAAIKGPASAHLHGRLRPLQDNGRKVLSGTEAQAFLRGGAS